VLAGVAAKPRPELGVGMKADDPVREPFGILLLRE
jgi:hypothetical protein